METRLLKLFNLVVIFFFLFLPSLLIAQEYKSLSELLVDSLTENQTIPATLLTSALEETNQVIQKTEDDLLPPPELAGLDSILAGIGSSIDEAEKIFTDEFLNDLEFLNVSEDFPQFDLFRSRLDDLNEKLQVEIEGLEDANNSVQHLLSIWRNTEKEAWYADVSLVLREQINGSLKELEKGHRELKQKFNGYLESQVKINALRRKIDAIVAQLEKSVDKQDGNLLERTGKPIWEILGSGSHFHFSNENFKKILGIRLKELKDFFGYNKYQFYLALIFFLLIQVFFYYLKGFTRGTKFVVKLDQEENTAIRLLQSNWSTGTVLGLLVVFITLYDKPRIVNNFIYIVSLVPIYILIRRLVDKRMRFHIGFLFFIFFITLASQPLLEFVIFRRINFAVLNIMIILWLGVALRRNWFGIFENRFLYGAVKFISRIYLILLIISLLANFIGGFRFTLLITYGVTGSFFYGLICYVIYLILIGIIAIFLNGKMAGRVRMIRNFRLEFESRIESIVRVILITVFVVLILRSFDLLDMVFKSIKNMMVYGMHIGEFSFTVGDIILFVIILVSTVWISDFVVFILKEQVYDKTRQKKDLAASVSALIKFAIITAGFLFAIVAIGFELDKLTILLSAFGVGIGFGLQNIFNNLVSGIIMVFEKPLQVGDVIEVGQLIGEVKKIGIRSSIVRTYDGSEVIVPNGNLISNELINWTHSDLQRRLIVMVGVAYGTDPEQVLGILKKVASDNKEIMQKPEPYALFTGFGDSSLDFELRCWTDNFDNWLTIISRLRVEVNTALKEAGITIPFPQRDVYLHTETPAGEGNTSSDNKKKK